MLHDEFKRQLLVLRVLRECIHQDSTNAGRIAGLGGYERMLDVILWVSEYVIRFFSRSVFLPFVLTIQNIGVSTQAIIIHLPTKWQKKFLVIPSITPH